VRSVEHDHQGVRVLTGDGEVTGDAVIVAVPMAVLRDLPFSPGFPPIRRAAWQRAGLAHNAKLHIPLTRPAGASAVQSVPDRFWTWTATDACGQVQPVVHAFAGTQAGLVAPAVADGPATWASRVAALRPELSMDPGRALLTTWNDDPWAGESYSALTVEAAAGDDELIAAPLGRVHIAGEHTAGAWSGLMEGALRSGARRQRGPRRRVPNLTAHERQRTLGAVRQARGDTSAAAHAHCTARGMAASQARPARPGGQ
jgi:monoamine oxidase